jgi:hypothetical protein
MTSTELIAELRGVLRDVRKPYLWSDNTLWGYLAEGQDRLCSDCGFFRDVNSYTIATVADQWLYPLSSRIREVLDVKLDRVSIYKFDPATDDHNIFFNGNTGDTPIAWTTALQTQNLAISPVPESVFTLTLITDRYSLVRLSKTAQPEIHENLHQGIVEWAAHRAFTHNDTELADPVRAGKHEVEYKRYVEEGKTINRKMHGERSTIKPNPLYNLGC